MEPVNIPFGTCQQRKLFPHFHPPNFLGNKFLPLRGVPHRGPGCYIADDVSIHLPLVGLSSRLPKVALVCGRKALWDLWSLGSQHKKEPWTSETRSQGQCQKLKDLFSALHLHQMRAFATYNPQYSPLSTGISKGLWSNATYRLIIPSWTVLCGEVRLSDNIITLAVTLEHIQLWASEDWVHWNA